jgi:hypothetical protein
MSCYGTSFITFLKKTAWYRGKGERGRKREGVRGERGIGIVYKSTSLRV